MSTISSKEFLKGGKVTLAQEGFKPDTSTQPASGGYLNNVVSQVKGNIQEASQSLNASDAFGKGGMNPLYAGANIAKNVSGALLAPVSQLPGLKQLGEGFGKVGQAIVDTKVGNKVTDFLSKKASPDTLGAISDTAETGLNMLGVEGALKGTTEGVDFLKNKVNQVKQAIPEKVSNLASGQPETIMNRVARLKPTDANRFQDLAGKSHGEYLRETGNFGAPDKIIANESTKFVNSKNAVDTELGKLPGAYRNGSITDALQGLYERAVKTSGENTPSPYLKQVQDWMSRYKNEGLSMGEINAVKRLYEKEVKLGYNKLNNPDGVEKATNIDNSLREWQVKQAEQLGFKNIGELNKQTQLSKFLINKLGDQIVGKNGLNGVSLTDWIVLSGGGPESIAGFLTKKLFSSPGVQAKIAEFLNKGNEIKGPVTPKVDNLNTINQEGVTPSTKISPQSEAILRQSSSKSTTMPKKINMQGGYIKNPFADVPENDWKFLSDFSDKVKNKQSVTKNDYEMVKSIFKENGLQLPNTPRKTVDYISTVNEAMSDRVLDTEMNKNLNKTYSTKQAQPRDKVGRYDTNKK